MSHDERGVGPPDEVSPGTMSGATHRNTHTAATADTGKPTTLVSSQQVSWWTVHEYVVPVLARAAPWPMAGTPEWCALDDGDPVKTAAALDAAQHWALRVETCQEAECAAAREVSQAGDWSAIAKEVLIRRAFYTHRPWLKRVSK